MFWYWAPEIVRYSYRNKYLRLVDVLAVMRHTKRDSCSCWVLCSDRVEYLRLAGFLVRVSKEERVAFLQGSLSKIVRYSDKGEYLRVCRDQRLQLDDVLVLSIWGCLMFYCMKTYDWLMYQDGWVLCLQLNNILEGGVPMMDRCPSLHGSWSDRWLTTIGSTIL
jgi:hypothetical protein